MQDLPIIANLTGTGLAVGVLLFMMRYFIKREERTEKFVMEVIASHTAAIKDNTAATVELRNALLSDKIPQCANWKREMTMKTSDLVAKIGKATIVMLLVVMGASDGYSAPIELEPGNFVRVNCKKHPNKKVKVECVIPEPTPSATPTPRPTATPTPRPTITATPTPTPSATIGAYLANFNSYGRTHCEALKSSAATNEQKLANIYYDAAWVYFQGYDHTRDSYWLGCAQAALAVYRDYYVVPNNGNVPGYWNFPHGLAEDCLRNHATASCNAVTLLATNAAFARDSTPEDTSDPQYSREVAYAIHAYLQAERVGAPRRQRLAKLVADAKHHIETWFVSRSAPYVRPFMVGLTAHALIAYHAATQDSTVVPFIQMAANGIYPQMWLPSARAFKYTDRETSSGGQEPAPDLNQLISPMYFWLASITGESTYADIGREVFAGGVAGGYLAQGKQFDQQYRWGFSVIP